MIKKILTIILFMTLSFSYAQADFTVKTIYTSTNNENFDSENFTFTYDYKNKNIIIRDMDLNIIRKYPVQFYDSSYSKDNNFYIIGFMSDLKRFNKLSRDQSFIGMFTFFYDKKNENLLWVQVISMSEDISGHSNKIDYYYTEKGKNEKTKK